MYLNLLSLYKNNIDEDLNNHFIVQALKNTNVNSTRFLLDLCVSVKPKKFCHISSISAANCSSNQKMVPKGELLHEPNENNGYLLSKRVSEKLILILITNQKQHLHEISKKGS
jgi:thioester reductase-like protein